MKRTKIRKKSKSPEAVAQEKLWDLCKAIVRKRYINNCYTCPATGLVGRNFQTGHMIAKGSVSAYLKYDLRILRPQCFKCNFHYGGMGATFIERMRNIEGNEYVDKIMSDRQVSVKSTDHYKKLINEYQIILDKLNEENK